MTDERYQDLPAAKRRRLIFRAVRRSVLAAAVLAILYYVLPLDRPWDADTAIRLLIGLLALWRCRPASCTAACPISPATMTW